MSLVYKEGLCWVSFDLVAKHLSSSFTQLVIYWLGLLAVIYWLVYLQTLQMPAGNLYCVWDFLKQVCAWRPCTMGNILPGILFETAEWLCHARKGNLKMDHGVFNISVAQAEDLVMLCCACVHKTYAHTNILVTWAVWTITCWCRRRGSQAGCWDDKSSQKEACSKCWFLTKLLRVYDELINSHGLSNLWLPGLNCMSRMIWTSHVENGRVLR